ncbi:MAG: HPr family phosphocarrier protein [Clostridiales bacterium]|nr:HPr family phosphocarrier protein [Clostridiales bacterium]
MVRFPIRFQSISDVKEFVQIVNSYPYDVDLSSGRYVVDAKSIMGIFSLELQSAINLEIHSNSCDDLVEALEPFRAEEK